LGKALITEVRSSGLNSASPVLFQRIQFATDVNPMARIAYGLYRGKFLNAVSVGFVPTRWINGDGTEYSVNGKDASSAALPPLDTQLSALDVASRGLRRKYLEQELLEVSAVAIPANPNALALGVKSGAVEKSDLRELADLLRLALEPKFCSNPAGSETDTRALGIRAMEAQLLQLARALKEALRH
jgi:hypothetical protein